MSNDWRTEWRKQAKADTPRRRGRTPARRQSGTHEFVVEKPYCMPARPTVEKLTGYGVKIHSYREGTVNVRLNGKDFPYSQRATFRVSQGQAAWAEYLLWRTNKLVVVGGNIDDRNKGWGKRHGGNMPVSWAEKKRAQGEGLKPPKPGQPWIEKTCEKGIAAWEPIMRAKKARSRR